MNVQVKFQIRSENEFIRYFNEYLGRLDKESKKYKDLVDRLSSINYFDLYAKMSGNDNILDLLNELEEDEVLDNSFNNESQSVDYGEKVKMGR